MQTISLIQGTTEWAAHRAQHWNASDAPAMLGCSPYKSRSQLIHELATGAVQEIDAATQRRFDDGHRFEALARPIAEAIVGEELYPVVGVLGRLSASFDGLVMAEDTGYESKTLNDELRAALPHAGRDSHQHNDGKNLPKMYRVQMEQQLMVADGTRILFCATKFDANDELLEERHCWYYPDEALRAEILAGWAQLEADVAAYKPVEVIPAAVAAPIQDLPALDIQITGAVVASNLALWRDIVVQRIAEINTDLKDDQDFADAAKMVTFLDNGEKRIKLVKEQAQAQASSIDEVFRALDQISAELKAKRLELNRLVEARKESIRLEILQEGKDALKAHIEQINATLKGAVLPAINADFAGAMKGKRTVQTLREAMQDCLAAAKIEANQIADGIRFNLTTYDEIGAEFPQLFPDLKQIVLKGKDDFTSTVKLRISEHKEQERQRQEREAKQRAEQAEREAAAARAAQEAEAQRKAGEQAASVIESDRKTEPAASVAMAAPLSVSAEQIEAGNVTPLRPAGGAMTDDEIRYQIGQFITKATRPQLNQILMFCRDKLAA